MSAPPLLVVEGLTVAFPGGDGEPVPAVRDLSLTIPAGGSVGLVGESGSGKTMATLAILGLTPPAARVSARRIAFEGRDLTGSPRALRSLRGSRIAYIPQDPLAALNPVLVVGDQITEVERMHPPGGRHPHAVREVLRGYGVGARSRATVERAAELLEGVSISEPRARAVQYPHEFSGGMRQRAIIASALSGSPSLVIADEPTSAIDASVEKQVLDLLGRRRAERGMAMLLVTHDLNVVSWHCDYVYVLYGGRLLEEGPTEGLFRRPRQPYTGALMAASPDLDRPPRPRERRRASERADPRTPGCPFAARCLNALEVCPQRFPEAEDAGSDHRFWCHNPL